MSALKDIMSPKSVAIVGASDDKGRIVGKPLSYMLDQNYSGKIFPVNPKHQTIQGLKSYKSLTEIEDDLDFVLVAVPSIHVTNVLNEAVKKKAKTALIFSSGFAEMGGKGKEYQAEIENISKFDPLTGKRIAGLRHFVIYPASHYVTGSDTIPTTINMIREELQERLEELHSQGKLVEYHRLKQRTEHDIERIEDTGFCQGLENYSRIIQRRPPGSAPTTLLDYLPENAIIFVDESHVSLPQVRGMYMGDRSRKTTLVEHGFRLPSAIDNRPLTFEEFEKVDLPFIYVSATPGDYELQKAGPQVAELVIRPTGLVDPPIEIRPVIGQVDDMLEEIRIRVEKEERVLITTLTKRMAEDLTDYL